MISLSPPKEKHVLKIGLLGASKIAPDAVIKPALNHPEIVVTAVASRDPKRGQEYAIKYHIPIVYTSYQELIDEPSIDAVYIALPNSLHYEWAVKSLQAGKHILLEKPSVSNVTEAMSLFRHSIFAQPDAPVLLEAFHSRFHPAFRTFLGLLDPPNIVSARSSAKAPLGYVSLDDIRFSYDLAGGSCMDPGSYSIMTLREMLGAEPVACLEAIPRMMPEGYDQKCDEAITAKFRFPHGALGEIDVDLRETGVHSIPSCSAVHREVDVPDTSLSSEEEHVCVRTVTLKNYMVPHVGHQIDTKEEHTVRSIKGKKIIKTWTETSSKQAYTWENMEKKGDPSWSTYRYQLEEFVNRIRGREGSGVWIDAEDSIRQMAMIDSVYEKSGLPHRPTSTFCK